MNSSAKASFFRQGSTVLGIIGLILILTYVSDFAIRLFAAQFENLGWQQSFLNELIDRGVTPLLGLAFLFVGTLFKFGSSDGGNNGLNNSSLLTDGRFWVFVVASLFGLLYLILIPLHFSTTGSILSETIAQFEQEATRAEQGIQAQQAQLQSIADSGQIDQLLSNEQLPQPQKDLLTEVKNNPEAVAERAQAELENVQSQKQTAIDRANSEALLARLRSEIRSLLLAIAYAVLGWTGLRQVLRG